jgi:RNA methyltransferase, TrmH family
MLEPITSLRNPRIQRAVKLRERKGRDEQGRIVIDGVREIERALGRLPFDEVFVCERLCQSAAARRLLARLASSATPIPVTPEVFAKLAYGERQEGLLVTAPTPASSLAELTLPACPLVAVLAGVEKPGNVGAVLRSADGAGLAALIVADGGTDLYNPNAIRASLGTIFTVPVCSASAAETLAWLRAQRVPLFAARVDGARWYYEADLRGPAAIVLGSEAAGLGDDWRAPDITAVKLPMLGVADSLNVSVTAGVLFYEARRQRASRPTAE